MKIDKFLISKKPASFDRINRLHLDFYMTSDILNNNHKGDFT